MYTVDAALMALRFAHIAAAAVLWGTYGYLLTCVPGNLANETTRRLRTLTFIAIAVTMATAIGALPVKTAMIGDGWADALEPRMLWAVMSATSIGTAWLVDIFGSILLVFALFLRSRQRSLAIATSSGVVLLSLVMTGHAMMREGWLGYLQQGNDLVHVLASAAWLGALAPLMVIMRSYPEKPYGEAHDIALRRFSAAGQVAVVLILLTGTANTLLIADGWPTNWSSAYMVLLSIKIAVVLVMIGLASRNHFVLTPRLARHRHVAASALRRTAMVEMGLGFAAVALVAVFGLMNPGPSG